MSFAIRIVQPSGLLSVAATNLFHAEIKNAIESNATIVLVDLKYIPSLSSGSFIAVIKALKLVRASGCQLVLCSLSEQIRILFELTGLDQVFKTFANADEFKRSMQLQRNTIELPRQTKADLDVLPVESFQLAS